MKGYLTSNPEIAKTRTPYHQVTFASLNRIKFYRDFNHGGYFGNSLTYLENQARLTIAELKSSSHFLNGIIKNILFDINSSEQMIYFDIILSSKTTRTSFVEVLSYLNSTLNLN